LEGIWYTTKIKSMNHFEDTTGDKDPARSRAETAPEVTEAIKFPEIKNEEEMEGMKFAVTFFADKYGKEAEKIWDNLKFKLTRELKKSVRDEEPSKFKIQKIYEEASRKALYNEYRRDILNSAAQNGGVDKKTIMNDIRFDVKRDTSFDQEAFDNAFNAAGERVAGIIVQQQKGPLGSSTH
jgi:hypothetical protein